MKKPILLVALFAASASAQSRPAPFTVVETGKAYYRLDDAVAAIGGGDGTIDIAPGRYKDCTVVETGRVAFRAAPGSAVFDSGACEGKATLVLRGRDAKVAGLTFEHVAVADGNGAGIRLEHGGLAVTDTVFRDSQQGILTADDEGATISIDRSTFSGLGNCDQGSGCAHSLYVGHYGKLVVTRTRFERGTGGHYLKSRAIRIEATGNSFDDSAGKQTNYMVDLCAGSAGIVADNVIVQGKDKDNHSALIAVAAESRDNPSAGLAIRDNRASLAPGAAATTFVADWSHEPLAIGANVLAKGIKPFETR